MIDPISVLGGAAGLVQKPAASTDDGLLDIAQRSFRVALLEAIQKRPLAAAPLPAPPPPLPPIAAEFRPPPLPVDESSVIRRSAEGAGVDPAFLQALRRAENGGPGREFGVLSVPAPTYDDQARVAARTIRRNVERFEGKGGQAIDPVSGRYTTEFIQFFSSRYAPADAANDPTGLNRHHARNLIRLYAQAAPRE
jgi:hypothetical protein